MKFYAVSIVVFVFVLIVAISYFSFFYSEAGVILVEGSSTAYPIVLKASSLFMEKNPGVDIKVVMSSSGYGVRSLSDRRVDIALMSRPLTNEELISSGKGGVHLEPYTIGLDGAVIIVNKDNPIENLDNEEIRSIFFERDDSIRSWSELGVEGLGDINTYVTDPEHSATAELVAKIFGGEDFIKSSVVVYPTSDVPGVVANDINGISYASLKYAAENPYVKVLDVFGVTPSADSIKKGTYTLSRELFMVVDREEKEKVKDFLDFVLSEEGQRIVVEEGYFNS